MTRAEALEILRAAGVPDALADVRRIERHAETQPDGWFGDAIQMRAARRPMSHILGYRDFWKHRFKITPDVLDPRPETEVLIAAALKQPFSKVLDLGTGSGAILLSLLAERPEATGVGTDVSEAAVLVAGENAAALGVADRIILPLSDWWEDVGGTYDLIVSNPPYIAEHELSTLAPEVTLHEPRAALTDWADGLNAYRAISKGLAAHLEKDGRVLFEIGPTQATAVSNLLADVGLELSRVHTDLDGRDRVVEARHPG